MQRTDALKKKGIFPRLRITAALRMLANGNAADALDEYLQMSDDSVLLSLKQFCEEVIELFRRGVSAASDGSGHASYPSYPRCSRITRLPR